MIFRKKWTGSLFFLGFFLPILSFSFFDSSQTDIHVDCHTEESEFNGTPSFPFKFFDEIDFASLQNETSRLYISLGGFDCFYVSTEPQSVSFESFEIAGEGGTLFLESPFQIHLLAFEELAPTMFDVSKLEIQFTFSENSSHLDRYCFDVDSALQNQEASISFTEIQLRSPKGFSDGMPGGLIRFNGAGKVNSFTLYSVNYAGRPFYPLVEAINTKFWEIVLLNLTIDSIDTSMFEVSGLFFIELTGSYVQLDNLLIRNSLITKDSPSDPENKKAPSCPSEEDSNQKAFSMFMETRAKQPSLFKKREKPAKADKIRKENDNFPNKERKDGLRNYDGFSFFRINVMILGLWNNISIRDSAVSHLFQLSRNEPSQMNITISGFTVTNSTISSFVGSIGRNFDLKNFLIENCTIVDQLLSWNGFQTGTLLDTEAKIANTLIRDSVFLLSDGAIFDFGQMNFFTILNFTITGSSFKSNWSLSSPSLVKVDSVDYTALQGTKISGNQVDFEASSLLNLFDFSNNQEVLVENFKFWNNEADYSSSFDCFSGFVFFDNVMVTLEFLDVYENSLCQTFISGIDDTDQIATSFTIKDILYESNEAVASEIISEIPVYAGISLYGAGDTEIKNFTCAKNNFRLNNEVIESDTYTSICLSVVSDYKLTIQDSTFSSNELILFSENEQTRSDHTIISGEAEVVMLAQVHDLTIENSMFLENNHHDTPGLFVGTGGAAYIRAINTLDISNCLFEENEALSSPALQIDSIGNPHIRIRDSIFKDNFGFTKTGFSLTIYGMSPYNLTITNCEFQGFAHYSDYVDYMLFATQAAGFSTLIQESSFDVTNHEIFEVSIPSGHWEVTFSSNDVYTSDLMAAEPHQLGSVFSVSSKDYKAQVNFLRAYSKESLDLIGREGKLVFIDNQFSNLNASALLWTDLYEVDFIQNTFSSSELTQIVQGLPLSLNFEGNLLNRVNFGNLVDYQESLFLEEFYSEHFPSYEPSLSVSGCLFMNLDYSSMMDFSANQSFSFIEFDQLTLTNVLARKTFLVGGLNGTYIEVNGLSIKNSLSLGKGIGSFSWSNLLMEGVTMSGVSSVFGCLSLSFSNVTGDGSGSELTGCNSYLTSSLGNVVDSPKLRLVEFETRPFNQTEFEEDLASILRVIEKIEKIRELDDDNDDGTNRDDEDIEITPLELMEWMKRLGGPSDRNIVLGCSQIAAFVSSWQKDAESFNKLFLMVAIYKFKMKYCNELVLSQISQGEELPTLEMYPGLFFVKKYSIAAQNSKGEFLPLTFLDKKPIRITMKALKQQIASDWGIYTEMSYPSEVFSDHIELAMSSMSYIYDLQNASIDFTEFMRQHEATEINVKVTIQEFNQSIEFKVKNQTCPRGYSINNSKCMMCVYGTYSIPKESSTCKTCLIDANCIDGNLELNNGTWRLSFDTDHVFRCQNPTACLKEELSEPRIPSITSNQYCKEGYFGALCMNCDLAGNFSLGPYYSSNFGTCEKCPSFGWSAAYMLFWLVGQIILQILLMIFHRGSIKRDLKGKDYWKHYISSPLTKMVLLYGQIVQYIINITPIIYMSEVLKTGANPTSFSVLNFLISIIQFASIKNSVFYFSPYLSCLFSNEFPDIMAPKVETWAFLFFVLFWFFFVLVFNLILKPVPPTRRWMWFISDMIIFYNFICPYIAAYATRILSYITFNENTDQEFFVNYEVTYKLYDDPDLLFPKIVFGVSLAIIVLIPFLIAAHIAVIMRSGPDPYLKSGLMQVTYSYLVTDFKHENFPKYYEIIRIFLIRLVIPIIANYEPFWGSFRFTVFFFILAFYLFLNYTMKPYRKRRLNTFDFYVGLFVMAILAMCVLIQSEEPFITSYMDSNDEEVSFQSLFELFIVIFMAINGFLLIIFLGYFLRSVGRDFRVWSGKRKQSVDDFYLKNKFMSTESFIERVSMHSKCTKKESDSLYTSPFGTNEEIVYHLSRNSQNEEEIAEGRLTSHKKEMTLEGEKEKQITPRKESMGGTEEKKKTRRSEEGKEE